MQTDNLYFNRRIRTILSILLIAAVCFSGQMSFADNSTTQWYDSGITEADEWGILPNDYENKSLKLPITRGEFAEAIVLAYVRVSGGLPETWRQDVFNDDSNAFADVAFDLELVSGYPNGNFKPYGPIKREEMFVMIQKLIQKIQMIDAINPSVIQEINGHFSDAGVLSEWAKEASALMVSRYIVTGTKDKKLAPKQVTTRAEAFIILQNAVETIVAAPNTAIQATQDIEKINAMVYGDYSNKQPVVTSKPTPIATPVDSTVTSPITPTDTATIPKNSGFNFDQFIEETKAEEVVSRGGRRGEWNQEEMFSPDELMVKLGNNAIKYASVFGAAEAARYQTSEEAKKHLVSVSVDVWVLGSNGMKTTSKRNVTVNKGIANTVVQIFKEIYNGPEKFPIKDLGGYAWRSSETSEHRWGLAIDINASENYMIRSDGSVVAGSFWKPGDSPYSILPIGDVVNTFKKYGFSWGGDAWSMSNDYMHVSFLGW